MVYMHLPSEKITLLAPRERWCDGSIGCMEQLQLEFGFENMVLRESAARK